MSRDTATRRRFPRRSCRARVALRICDPQDYSRNRGRRWTIGCPSATLDRAETPSSLLKKEGPVLRAGPNRNTDPPEKGSLHRFLRKTLEGDDVIIVIWKCCVSLRVGKVKVVHPRRPVKGSDMCESHCRPATTPPPAKANRVTRDSMATQIQCSSLGRQCHRHRQEWLCQVSKSSRSWLPGPPSRAVTCPQ